MLGQVVAVVEDHVGGLVAFEVDDAQGLALVHGEQDGLARGVALVEHGVGWVELAFEDADVGGGVHRVSPHRYNMSLLCRARAFSGRKARQKSSAGAAPQRQATSPTFFGA
ncbi:hypothetical protein D9M69_526280 [compost metagenome]